MKIKELIRELRKLDPESHILIAATPALTVPAKIEDGVMMPEYIKSFDPTRGSLMLRRKQGESILISVDGKVIAEVTPSGHNKIRVTAPRSVVVMRKEISDQFTEEIHAKAHT